MCAGRDHLSVPGPEGRARGVPEAAVGARWCVSAAASRACNGGVAIAGAPRPTCMAWHACNGRGMHGTRTPYMERGRHVSRGPPWGVWSPWGFHPAVALGSIEQSVPQAAADPPPARETTPVRDAEGPRVHDRGPRHKTPGVIPGHQLVLARGHCRGPASKRLTR